MFGRHDKYCLTSTFCLSVCFKNIFCLSQAKNVCQASVCVVAKPTDIVLDKQNFKCLPNNVCPFCWGLNQYLPAGIPLQPDMVIFSESSVILSLWIKFD